MKRKNERGQTLPYLLVMTLVLVISWGMMLNIAKLLQDRMIAQNAADNAALTISSYRARVLTRLAWINYAIASYLYDGLYATGSIAIGTKPLGIANYYPNIEFNIDFILTTLPKFALNPLGIVDFFVDLYKSGGPFNLPRYGGPFGTCAKGKPLFLPTLSPILARRMSHWDNQSAVASLDDMYKHSCPGTNCDFDLSGNDDNIDRVFSIIKKLIDAQTSLRAAYPMNAAKYAKEITKRQDKDSKGNYCGPEMFSIGLNKWSLNLERNTNGIVFYKTCHACISAPVDPVGHLHFFWGKKYEKLNSSWLYIKGNGFAKNNKVTIVVRKNGADAEKMGYPIFGKWLGIKWPDIYAVSSAAVYNKKGPMFPVENGGKPSDRISPVFEEYLKAKDSGYYAQLVPVGGVIQH